MRRRGRGLAGLHGVQRLAKAQEARGHGATNGSEEVRGERGRWKKKQTLDAVHSMRCVRRRINPAKSKNAGISDRSELCPFGVTPGPSRHPALSPATPRRQRRSPVASLLFRRSPQGGAVLQPAMARGPCRSPPQSRGGRCPCARRRPPGPVCWRQLEMKKASGDR